MVSSNQIYWGAWLPDWLLPAMQAFEAQVGKNASIENAIFWWAQGTDVFDFDWMTTLRNNGIIPMISWSPNNQADSSFVNLDSILNGSWDSYLAAWGRASAKWGHPYFVRLMWEFNGYWVEPEGIYPYGPGNTPQKFVEAWQYIVSHVRAAEGGKEYITWVWCPAGLGDSVSTLQALYPGDQYVDWVGTDVYAPEVSSGLGQGNDIEIASIRAIAPNKPFMFAEIGDLFGDTKTAWWTDIFNELPTTYSYVKAIILWEMPSGGLTVVSPSDTLSAFRQGISSSYYSSNVFSSLNTSPIPVLGVTPQYTLQISTGVV